MSERSRPLYRCHQPISLRLWKMETNSIAYVSNRVLGALSCLLLVAITTAPAYVFAQAKPSLLHSESACPSGFDFTTAHPSDKGTAVKVPPLTTPSLRRAEAILIQVARRIIWDPQLFAFEIHFDGQCEFRQRGPSCWRFTMTAHYSSPCNQTQYLEIGQLLDNSGRLDDLADVGPTEFIPSRSCWAGGNLMGGRGVPTPMPSPVLEAEPQSKHPPIQGWTVDLPQLWRIAKNTQRSSQMASSVAWSRRSHDSDKMTASACAVSGLSTTLPISMVSSPQPSRPRGWYTSKAGAL
jgi:hypothetical protein